MVGCIEKASGLNQKRIGGQIKKISDAGSCLKMTRLPLIYLVLVMSFVPDMELIFIGVCGHLYANGWGWSSDETAAKSLGELARRNRDQRFARCASTAV